jgi:hypothetical protein
MMHRRTHRLRNRNHYDKNELHANLSNIRFLALQAHDMRVPWYEIEDLKPSVANPGGCCAHTPRRVGAGEDLRRTATRPAER